MRKHILYLFTFLLIYSTTQGQDHEIRVTATYYKGTDILESKWEYYHDSWSEQKIRHGKYSYWDRKGRLKWEENYAEDKLHGPHKTFYLSGNIKKEIPHKHGVIDGIARFYFRSGKLKKQFLYQNGKKDGLMKTYHKNGELKVEKRFIKGKKQPPISPKNQAQKS